MYNKSDWGKKKGKKSILASQSASRSTMMTSESVSQGNGVIQDGGSSSQTFRQDGEGEREDPRPKNQNEDPVNPANMFVIPMPMQPGQRRQIINFL